MKLKEAKQTAPGFGNRNSKMPGTAYSITATACQTGGKLRHVKGSPCSKCYALRLEKYRANVGEAWSRNLAWFNDHADRGTMAQWIAAAVLQVSAWSKGYHRWFDSGDLQSVDMLDAIVAVARQTPEVKHWLPTQERGYVNEWRRANGDFPSNLVVRVSAARIDGTAGKVSHGSVVVSKAGNFDGMHKCPASGQGNACGDCRACWDMGTKIIGYPLH